MFFRRGVRAGPYVRNGILSSTILLFVKAVGELASANGSRPADTLNRSLFFWQARGYQSEVPASAAHLFDLANYSPTHQLRARIAPSCRPAGRTTRLCASDFCVPPSETGTTITPDSMAITKVPFLNGFRCASRLRVPSAKTRNDVPSRKYSIGLVHCRGRFLFISAIHGQNARLAQSRRQHRNPKNFFLRQNRHAPRNVGRQRRRIDIADMIRNENARARRNIFHSFDVHSNPGHSQNQPHRFHGHLVHRIGIAADGACREYRNGRTR